MYCCLPCVACQQGRDTPKPGSSQARQVVIGVLRPGVGVGVGVIQNTTAWCSSSRVRQRRRSRTFFWSRACQDSIAALSPAEATRPIDPCRPAAVRTARKLRARNCDPRSLWTRLRYFVADDPGYGFVDAAGVDRPARAGAETRGMSRACPGAAGAGSGTTRPRSAHGGPQPEDGSVAGPHRAAITPSPPCPTPSAGPTTTASELKASATTLHPSAWLDAASTSSTPCSATAPSTKPQCRRRLDPRHRDTPQGVAPEWSLGLLQFWLTTVGAVKARDLNEGETGRLRGMRPGRLLTCRTELHSASLWSSCTIAATTDGFASSAATRASDSLPVLPVVHHHRAVVQHLQAPVVPAGQAQRLLPGLRVGAGAR